MWNYVKSAKKIRTFKKFGCMWNYVKSAKKNGEKITCFPRAKFFQINDNTYDVLIYECF